MNADELIALNEEIAALARAGLPLDKGLAALARDLNHSTLRTVVQELANDLEQGKTLPEALDHLGNRVPPFYAALVSAGVRSGRIGDVLGTLTAYARSMSELGWSVLEAVLYPLTVFLFAVALMGTLLTWIIPQFESIYRDFGMRLPAITELAIWMGHYSTFIFIIPFALVLLLLIAWLLMRATPQGHRLWTQMVYSIPLIGSLVRSSRLAGFTELLGIMVEREIPLPEAFRLAGLASSDPLTSHSSQQIAQQISHGQPLGEALRGHGLVPEWVAWMTSMGEIRGNLGPMLRQIATMYRQQAQSRITMLRNILPPFLLMTTGAVFVIIFVFALMAPMIKLLEGLSK